MAHLEAKAWFYDFFRAQGKTVELEYPLGSSRADIYVLGPRNISVAFEMQHTAISPDEIARRTRAYFAQGVAVGWLVLINVARLEDACPSASGLVVPRYAPRPFERWLQGFGFGQLWFADPAARQLWQGGFKPCTIPVPYSEWYLPGGEKTSVGGYDRVSKRWKRLDLTGPYSLDMMDFRLARRKESRIGYKLYPAGMQVRMKGRGPIVSLAP